MKTKKGFTLVELLVVIAIIGLLATIAFISLGSARSKARDAKRVSDVRQVMAALELYYGTNNGYPDDNTAGLGYVAWSGIQTDMAGFIGTMPPDVGPADGPAATCPTGTNNTYMFQSLDSSGATCDAGPCAAYSMRFCLGAATGGLGAGLRTATPNGIQ